MQFQTCRGPNADSNLACLAPRQKTCASVGMKLFLAREIGSVSHQNLRPVQDSCKELGGFLLNRCNIIDRTIRKGVP
jgi:hypothetical protein